MKGYANAALRKAAYRILAVVFVLALLPGCAVVGPLLSVGGMAGLAPLQYASTAFTVGEFSYEYAVNDKDPSEVIGKKIDDVMTGKAFMLPEFIPGAEDLNNGTMLADNEEVESAQVTEVAEGPALSAEARNKRIEQILGRRTAQQERLELRRMAFLRAKSNGNLTLRQTAMASQPDLFQGAVDETTLR